jgi:hypothetical protein
MTNRERFMTHVQKLNTLSFLELSTTLDALYKQYRESLSYENNKQVENGDPKKYVEKFDHDQLTCLISAMNPEEVKKNGISSISNDDRAKYLHHWADWLWVFYMAATRERKWFFEQMRSLEWSSQLLDDHEAKKKITRHWSSI